MSKKIDRFSLLHLIITIGLFVLAIFILLDTPLSLQKLEEKLVPKTEVFAQLPVAPPAVAGISTAPKVVIVNQNLAQPIFSAQAVIAEDVDSGDILFQKNIHARLAPASTTKLMTALVAMDNYKVSDILTVYPGSLVEGSTMGLKLNEKLSFTSLLYGMLLNSGNDAAYTLALNYPGGMPAFIEAMNKKVETLGLTDTHFVNPAGFDDPNHYSSAYDLAIIAKETTKYPLLAKVVATKQMNVSSLPRNESTTSAKIVHQLSNLNKLLSEPGVIGIKTGYTEKAGENFVGLVDRNDRKVITVVLNSVDRFGETKTLMDWIFQNFLWKVE